MRWFTSPSLVCAATLIMAITLFPQKASSSFWDTDTLKIAGIAAGSALALGIIIVLVAGAIEDVKGDDGEYHFSKNRYSCADEHPDLDISINTFATKPCLFLNPERTLPKSLSAVSFLSDNRFKERNYQLIFNLFHVKEK